MNKSYKRLENRLDDIKASKKTPADSRYISTTDPDASVTRHSGSKSKLRYKTHRAVDEKHEIITATKVTAGSVDDGHVLEDMIEAHEQNTQHKLETNDVLTYIDVLITDYSGVYFDYLLLNRPVIFAAFDLEGYVEQRGLYDDYAFYIAGPIAKNWSEVIEHARDALINPEKFEGLRSEKNKIFNKHCDGNSSMRVCGYLKGIVDGKGPQKC